MGLAVANRNDGGSILPADRLGGGITGSRFLTEPRGTSLKTILNGGKVRLTVERPHEKPFETTLIRRLITLEPSPHLEFHWSEVTNTHVASACRHPLFLTLLCRNDPVIRTFPDVASS